MSKVAANQCRYVLARLAWFCCLPQSDNYLSTSQCVHTCFLLLQNGLCTAHWSTASRLYCCRELSWEAATERMLDAAEMGPGDWPKAATKVAEATLFSAYNAALGTPCSWAVVLLCQLLCFCCAKTVGCCLQLGLTGSHLPMLHQCMCVYPPGFYRLQADFKFYWAG